MPWLAVDATGEEWRSTHKPIRGPYYWADDNNRAIFTGETELLEEGSIKRLIGRELTWDDEPVEFTEVVK